MPRNAARIAPCAVAAALLLALTAAVAQGAAIRWEAAALLGDAWNARTPLTIRQAGQPPLHLDARYETRGFERPLYYDLRLSRWAGRRAWELELIHHKLHLRDPPPQVQRFTITHGFNLLTLNRAWARAPFVLRLGAGVVVAHPENTVRGRTPNEQRGPLDSGYHLAGPALLAAAAVRLPLGRRLSALAEAKATAAHARVPVAEGHAGLTHLALHAAFGLGWRFRGAPPAAPCRRAGGRLHRARQALR